VYSILVGGEMGSTGRIVLNLRYALPPSNDAFTNAVALSGDSLEIDGSIIGATHEPGETNHVQASTGQSVWFSWTAPTNPAAANHPISFSVAGSDFDAVLAAYTGANLAALMLVSNANERAWPERDVRLKFGPEPGVTYHVVVDGSAQAANPRLRLGNYRLHLDNSVVNLDVFSLVRSPATVGGPVDFNVQFSVFNYGPAPTGRLRVRLLARSGESRAALHRAPAPTELELGAFPVLTDRGLVPGEPKLVPLTPASAQCPAPYVEGGRTNLWGVFAVLEEELGEQWVQTDSDFLFYGNPLESGDPSSATGCRLHTAVPCRARDQRDRRAGHPPLSAGDGSQHEPVDPHRPTAPQRQPHASHQCHLHQQSLRHIRPGLLPRHAHCPVEPCQDH
jgi:hypothetical protein